MATDKQREAARRNGAKSTGPKTEAGKRKSARNSTKHGLTSHHPFLFTNESEEYYFEILDGYEAQFQPANQAEADLVKTIALEQFRQERWRAIETAAIDVEMDRQRTKIANEFLTIDGATRQALGFSRLADESTSLQLINRYLNSSRRAYERAMRLLLELQDRRRKQPEAITPPGPTAEITESEQKQNLQNEPPVKQTEPNEAPANVIRVHFERRELLVMQPNHSEQRPEHETHLIHAAAA